MPYKKYKTVVQTAACAACGTFIDVITSGYTKMDGKVVPFTGEARQPTCLCGEALKPLEGTERTVEWEDNHGVHLL